MALASLKTIPVSAKVEFIRSKSANRTPPGSNPTGVSKAGMLRRKGSSPTVKLTPSAPSKITSKVCSPWTRFGSDKTSPSISGSAAAPFSRTSPRSFGLSSSDCASSVVPSSTASGFSARITISSPSTKIPDESSCSGLSDFSSKYSWITGTGVPCSPSSYWRPSPTTAERRIRCSRFSSWYRLAGLAEICKCRTRFRLSKQRILQIRDMTEPTI